MEKDISPSNTNHNQRLSSLTDAIKKFEQSGENQPLENWQKF